MFLYIFWITVGWEGSELRNGLLFGSDGDIVSCI